MGSKGLDVSDPERAKRFAYTTYMTAIGRRFAQVKGDDELRVFVPTAYRWLRVVLADAIERDQEIASELKRIDNNEEFLERAKERVYRRDQDPGRIAERERLWAKMEALEKLAVRSGLWGREERPPDPTADEVFEDQDFDSYAEVLDEDEVGGHPPDEVRVDGV